MTGTDLVIAGVVVGGLAGIALGQWHADLKRARTEMNKTWKNRSNYRKGNDKK